MRVTVVWAAAPRTVHETTLELPHGATAAEALARAGWPEAVRMVNVDARSLSVWGRRVEPQTPLRDGDRLEVTRALRVDPKQARRERFQRQGARTAGLFARQPRR